MPKGLPMIAGQVLSAPAVAAPSILWYVTRATGIISLVLLTATVVLGVIGTARAASERWPRLVTAGLHRNLALTSAALVLVHIVTTVLDPFAQISVVASVIPFSSAYRPLWLSLGTVGFDLLLAVLITSLLRDRLNHRTWQAVHLMVYVSWPVALWHGLGTGTDTKLAWVLAIDVICAAAVGWAVWWRLSLTDNPAIRSAGLLSLVLLPLVTLVFVFFGPLQPGWSRRAGTPVALLGARGGTVQAATGSGQAAPLVNASFTGNLAVASGPGENQRTITITGTTVAAPHQSFVIVLHGAPSGGGGVSLTDGNVRIGQQGTAAGFSGPVVQLNQGQLIAAVTGQAGRRQAQFNLTINGSAVTGTVSLLTATGE